MAAQPTRSGNPPGRPPRAPEMRAIMTENAETIARLLPNVRMRAHDLLRCIYTNENMPLPIRLQAATACLPVENRGLSCAELLDDMRRKALAAKMKANGAAKAAPPPIPSRASTAPAAPSAPETLNAADYIE